MSHGFKCSNVHTLEKLNIFFINKFELGSYQVGNEWKEKLNPIENRNLILIELFTYWSIKIIMISSKNYRRFHVYMILNLFVDDVWVLTQVKMFWWNTNRCEKQGITAIKTSNGAHLRWRKSFHRIQIYFGISSDFEADNEVDNSWIEKNITNIHRQNAVCKGSYKISE